MAIFTNLYYAYQSSKNDSVPFSNMEMKGDWSWVHKAGRNRTEDAPEDRNAIRYNTL